MGNPDKKKKKEQEKADKKAEKQKAAAEKRKQKEEADNARRIQEIKDNASKAIPTKLVFGLELDNADTVAKPNILLLKINHKNKYLRFRIQGPDGKEYKGVIHGKNIDHKITKKTTLKEIQKNKKALSSLETFVQEKKYLSTENFQKIITQQSKEEPRVAVQATHLLLKNQQEQTTVTTNNHSLPPSDLPPLLPPDPVLSFPANLPPPIIHQPLLETNEQEDEQETQSYSSLSSDEEGNESKDNTDVSLSSSDSSPNLTLELPVNLPPPVDLSTVVRDPDLPPPMDPEPTPRPVALEVVVPEVIETVTEQHIALEEEDDGIEALKNLGLDFARAYLAANYKSNEWFGVFYSTHGKEGRKHAREFINTIFPAKMNSVKTIANLQQGLTELITENQHIFSGAYRQHSFKTYMLAYHDLLETVKNGGNANDINIPAYMKKYVSDLGKKHVNVRTQYQQTFPKPPKSGMR